MALGYVVISLRNRKARRASAVVGPAGRDVRFISRFLVNATSSIPLELVPLVAVIAAMGCAYGRNANARPTDACPPGTLSCPCNPDATCSTTAAKRLLCDRGYCVPDDCPAGSKACRCYPNATCDPLDGVPMTCDGNVCKKTTLPAPGNLNGECLQDQQCGQYNGTPMKCTAGTCQVASCPSGQVGCPCVVYGGCSAVGGQTTICNQGSCVAPSCAEGDVGCPCPDGGACKGGLQCTVGVCKASGPLLRLTAAGARACDVLLALPELAGAKATFDASLIGETYQRGTRFALSFAAREDKDVSGSIATVERVPTW